MSRSRHEQNAIPAHGPTRALLEWTLVLLVAPVLGFPSAYPFLTVSVLAVVGTVFVILTVFDRQAVPLSRLAGPFRFPWAILAVGMLVGALVSPVRELTLPKFSGFVLGMLVFRAVLLTGTSSSRIWLLAWAYLLIGSSIVVAGLFVSPLWPGWKNDVLYSLSAKIPRLARGLPGAERGSERQRARGFHVTVSSSPGGAGFAESIKRDWPGSREGRSAHGGDS